MIARIAMVLTVIVLLTLASGCNRPRREGLVVLSSSTAPIEVRQDAAATIALGRITVPEYLDGYDVVMRTSSHELRRIDGARWAERLPDAVARVLRTGLAANGVQVVDDAARAVSVEIAAFEAMANGVVVLSAAWVVRDDGRQQIANGSVVTEQPAGSGAAAQAAAMELALQQLAADIAKAIKGLPSADAVVRQ